jgi:DNA-binding NarL/FixJ family response regulator/class 3 adenylate cyclase
VSEPAAPLETTFLFTDVVGSTALAERLPAVAAQALARQHEIVATAVEAEGGHVFERIGDAAYAAIPDPLAAVRAAVEVQRRVAAEDWGEAGRLRVRIALDHGEVERRGGRYFGTPLFRAARLEDLANGGEILLSGHLADLVASRLPDDQRLRDLGPQRLRGMIEPVRVWALVHTAHGATPAAGPREAPAEPTPRREEEQVSFTEGRIRVMLVDDHQVVRRGLRGFLELLPDMEVVGEAGDGEEAVALADRLQPDVVLMDLLMPKMDGLTAIATIKQAHPEVEIVAVTSFIEEEKVTSALEAGASGYLLKDADAEEVASAIRDAFAGEVHLDPAVARLLAQRMRSRKVEEPVEPLTAREKEVLAQLARGASNKEIAYQLSITERTARTHVSNILGKLGLASRTQAALYAVEHKLV